MSTRVAAGSSTPPAADALTRAATTRLADRARLDGLDQVDGALVKSMWFNASVVDGAFGVLSSGGVGDLRRLPDPDQRLGVRGNPAAGAERLRRRHNRHRGRLGNEDCHDRRRPLDAPRRRSRRWTGRPPMDRRSPARTTRPRPGRSPSPWGRRPRRSPSRCSATPSSSPTRRSTSTSPTRSG